MMGILILAVVIVLIVIWLIGTQRALVVMDENINNAMSQIGVQMSSRFDALTALLELTKGYDKHESETLLQTVQARRSVITGKSSAKDVESQENIITEALGKISMVAEQYPDLKANENYAKIMDSVNQYENMVRTSRLIYNDSVTKLNRAVRMFPASLIAGTLGFVQRDYLQTDNKKTEMPSMK